MIACEEEIHSPRTDCRGRCGGLAMTQVSEEPPNDERKEKKKRESD
jgi:hypothetical protein